MLKPLETRDQTANMESSSIVGFGSTHWLMSYSLVDSRNIPWLIIDRFGMFDEYAGGALFLFSKGHGVYTKKTIHDATETDRLENVLEMANMTIDHATV